MGWEARVFYRPAAAAEAALVHESLKGPAEDRTDVYQSHSASVGLKVRGGGGLELKVREDFECLSVAPHNMLERTIQRLGTSKVWRAAREASYL